MPSNHQVEVKKLSLDLKNFRTTPQKSESGAVKAMISIKQDRFFAVLESIIDDGYLLTENIIVLKDGEKLTVKEGNRRIGALKLIHGFLKIHEYGIPTTLIEKINRLNDAWKKENLHVPCTIFNIGERDKADKVVTLAHGKGEKASRDPWNSVARARHNRDVKNGSEPALDVLESYLKTGRNLTGQQKERWGGEFPLTVLNEAISKIHMRFGFTSSIDFANKYPKINFKENFDEVIRDIGLEKLETRQIRDAATDAKTFYGIPLTTDLSTSGSGNVSQNSGSGSNSAESSGSQSSSGQNSGQTANSTTRAYSTTDARHVAGLLKKFSPKGSNRAKVVKLRDELRRLKITDTPIAFCLVLRSIFETSAKVYANENGISLLKSGKEKRLVDLLRDITNHLTNNNSNSGMVKTLHGAMTEMGRTDGLLSVTSMNQLVHNTTFSIIPQDICTLFGNIYPLLEAMN